MKVAFSERALSDLLAIRTYIRHFNPSAARRVAERITVAAKDLGVFPLRGIMRPDGTREWALASPYVIVYEVVHDEITVLRIWHGAQNRD